MPDQYIEATEAEFETRIAANPKPVLVDFWAAWCGPCQTMATTISVLADQYGDRMVFAKCNVDEQPGLASRFNVDSIPTLILFKGGKPVDVFNGLTPLKQVAQGIEKIIGGQP